MVTFGEHNITFQVPAVRSVFIVRKLTGNFPNYEAVMPQHDSLKFCVTFPAADSLHKTLSRVAQLADERSGAVRWQVNGAVSLSASSDGSTARAIVSGARVEHTEDVTEMAIGLNSEYVAEFLKVAGKNPVTLSLRNGESAGMLTSSEIPGYSYIVMPMRI